MTRVFAALFCWVAWFQFASFAQEAPPAPDNEFKETVAKWIRQTPLGGTPLEREVLGQSETRAITLGDTSINYRLTVDRIGIFDRTDVIPPADVVSFSYEAEAESVADAAERPVIFAFNGGPGSASLWLHMGAWGPQRIERGGSATDFGEMPYSLEANPGFLLDAADIVFVDPVNTGLSKPRDNTFDNIVTYSSLRRDARGNCLFAKNWLRSRGADNRPVYFAGESYGSLRVAAMTAHPICKRQRFNLRGLIMVSGLLDLAARADQTEKVVEAFPTYAAIAWFHGKIDKSKFDNDFEAFVAAAQDMAVRDLGPALFQRGFVDQEIIDAAREKACDFLGIEQVAPNYCLSIQAILQDQSFRPCVYDARFNCRGVRRGYPYYPPGLDALGAEFARHLRSHVLEETGFDIGADFTWRGPSISHGNWDWRFQPNNWGRGVNMAEHLTPNTAHSRPSRFGSRQKSIRVLSLSGTYDLIAPYFGMERAFVRAGVTFEQINYEAGHMMYMDRDIAIKLADDIRRFIRAG